MSSPLLSETSSSGTASTEGDAVPSSRIKQQQPPTRKNSSNSNSFRRARPFLFVVTAAVATTAGIIWTVTQQLGLSAANTDILHHGSSSSSRRSSSGMSDDFWLPEQKTAVVATTPRLRNASAAAAAAAAMFPLPHFTKENVVVLVMTARKHYEHRMTIRNTWAQGHDNVYFLLAAPCPYPPSLRTNSMDCQRSKRRNNNEEDDEKVHQDYAKRLKWEHEQLIKEQASHQDLIYLGNATESYRGLPHKLKEAYDWVLQQFEYQNEGKAGIRWIVKVDDDTVVRVATLQHMLLRYNADIPMVIGRIIPKSQVWRDGKWAEFPQFKRPFYPYWPQGSCGHVVSRPVAEFLSHNKRALFNYQGEDTSLGIWLDESPYMRNETMWVHTPYFINEGDCTNPEWIIMGHDIRAQKMKDCHALGDEAQRTRSWYDQRAKYSPTVDFVPGR